MRGTSSHHFLWCRKDYETSIEKRLRSHHGMKATIPNVLHYTGYPESVHTLLDAPPKPELGRVIGGVALLDSKSQGFLSQPAEVLQMMAQYFGTEGDEELGNHLFAQYEILKDSL